MDFPLLLSAAEMRAADAAATREFGLPSLLLMENAGRGLADVVRRELGAAAPAGFVAIVCGAGANGGDGFVAARHLALGGLPVRVWLTSPRTKISGDAGANLAALEKTVPGAVEDGSGWTEASRWTTALGSPGAVVDAIFGIGFRGTPAGVSAAAIEAMNASSGRKIAADIPSGLDADTGRAPGAVFRADVTATMGACKVGLMVDSSAPVGRVDVVDLGLPLRADGAQTRLLETAAVAWRLPRRASDANKGSSGHLLVVAGSAGKTGAGLLVGTAALRTGAGLVTVASTAAGQTALDSKVVELMTARYVDGDEVYSSQTPAVVNALARRARAVAIGPGIPTDEPMHAAVRELAATMPIPMVIDADALNALGSDAAKILSQAAAPRILTPHPGEMGRLIDRAIPDVQSDRLGHARRLAAESRAVVVLKGARTVIAAPDGHALVSPIACSALATAGSGDVLCGVIGALLARGLDPVDAAAVGVHVHALAGEELATRFGDGAVAGDLPPTIATVMARLAARYPAR